MRDKVLREKLQKAGLLSENSLSTTYKFDRLMGLDPCDIASQKRLRELEIKYYTLLELLGVEETEESFKGLKKGTKKVKYK